MSILCSDLSKDVLAKLNNYNFTGDPTTATSVQFALSITHGAVFVQYALNFLSRKEQSTEAQQPLSLDKLNGKLKHEYLDYLKEVGGMDGLHTFLTTFIGSLAKREGRAKQNRA